MDQDNVIIKIQLDSNISEERKQSIYMDIINSLNERFIPVLSILNNEEEVFNNTIGFTKRRM